MKLAIVHDWLVAMRGGEKCLEVLCQHFPDAHLFTLFWRRGACSPNIERMRIRTSMLDRLPCVHRYYRFLLPLMPLAVSSLRLPRQLDAVISLSHAVAKAVRVPAGVPHICYCFTPMRYAWTAQEEYLAALQYRGGPLLRWLGRQVLGVLRQWDRRTSAQVTHFVAISRTVAARIARFYGRPSRVIYPPVDVDFFKPASIFREDFYLCVSALVPYKRIDLAVEAANRLGRRLVVIGSGPELDRLKRRAGSNTQFLGWQSDEAIRDHYRRARALLFPAEEDFGIVPVEAQACGCPVIAYGKGGASETVIDMFRAEKGTGMLFYDQDADALAAAMEKFESNTGRFDAQLARANAERFSQRRFQQELIAYIHQVVEQWQAVL